eukprot:Pgem_evm2s3751
MHIVPTINEASALVILGRVVDTNGIEDDDFGPDKPGSLLLLEYSCMQVGDFFQDTNSNMYMQVQSISENEATISVDLLSVPQTKNKKAATIGTSIMLTIVTGLLVALLFMLYTGMLTIYKFSITVAKVCSVVRVFGILVSFVAWVMGMHLKNSYAFENDSVLGIVLLHC